MTAHKADGCLDCLRVERGGGAQAGAVACTIQLAADDWNPYELLDIARLYVEGASGLEAGDELFIERIRECLHQQKRTQDSAPPAAVPVEALEGLVGRLNALEEYADEARVAYAGDHSSGTFRRIAERTQGIRDELTQLIKERSNG